MATYDQTGSVVDDLSPVNVTAQKIDKATGQPMPVLEEFGITGKRVTINWAELLIGALLGLVVLEITKPARKRRRR